VYFQIGSYKHEIGEVNFLSHQKHTRSSPRGARATVIEQMHIRVSVKAEDVLELTQELIERSNAYDDYLPVGLFADDGTPTIHQMSNAGTVDGVQIKQYSFLEDNGAENNIWRTLDIVLQAERISPADQITKFREVLKFIGSGNPLYTIIQTFNGPKFYLLANSTPVVLHQWGYAEGLEAYPLLALPAPKFPQYEIQTNRQFDLIGPERGTVQRIGYGMQWRYHMILPGPATVFPMIR
jgi:hypothetical protein